MRQAGMKELPSQDESARMLSVLLKAGIHLSSCSLFF
jgi:hypothetical protein